jgi:hypothetical protein
MKLNRSIGAEFKETDDKLAKRRAWFLALVRESQIAGDAFIISSPGSDVVLVEQLPLSSFAAQLRARGYALKEIAGGSRILPHAHHQPMMISSSGAMIPVVEGSTKPVTIVIHGAGPHETRRFEFPAPFRLGR